jgi:hypothetical protein
MADLTSLPAVKTYLGIPLNQTEDDALLQSLIAGVSVGLQNWIGRDLALGPHTDRVDGNGKPQMLFPAWPVSAVASVTIDGRKIPAATSAQSYGYRFDATMLILNADCFPWGYRNVELAYTAGYATVPADVAQVCTKLVAGKYKERDWLGYRSKGLAGETVVFDDVELSDSVRSVLWGYKKVFA